MNVLETVSKELTQIPETVHFSVEYLPNLPTVEKQIYFHNTEGRYWIDWTEELGAWITADGSDVKIIIREDAKDMDVGELTLGFTSVLTGIYLNLQGQVAIHANAVSLKELAIAFVGYSGKGKSTLSAYCASRGAGFITDDVFVIDKNALVIPGNPRIKLYPHTGENLGLDVSEKTDYKIFYEAGQLGAKLHQQPVPLGIIYLLDESLDHRIYSEQIPQSQAVFELLTHGYDVSIFVPNNPNLLDAYTRLVTQVPIKKLFYPRDFTMLPKVYDFLLKEIHSL
jgi:hypothetical protein